MSCVICTEEFKSTDNISSTLCGHVFHQTCLVNWQLRSRDCPQCRTPNVQSHKIYLSTQNSDSDCEKLKGHLEENIKQLSEVQNKLDQSEENFLMLQLQFVEMKSQHELSVKTLSETQKLLDKSNEDFLSLQKQSSETEEELKCRNVYLSVQNDTKDKKIKHLQNAITNSDKDTGGSGGNDQKIAILEEKLRQMEQELQKEIKNSTDLLVDKLKLQSIVEQFKISAAADKKPNAAPSGQFNWRMRNAQPPIHTQQQGQSPIYTQQQVQLPIYMQQQAPQPVKSIPMTPKKDGNDKVLTSVVIKGVPESVKKNSLRHFVLNLATMMELSFEPSDIVETCVMEKKLNFRLIEYALLVKFQTLEMKIRFLRNKDMLKRFPQTMQYVLYEYVTDDVKTLFDYAKSLRRMGFVTYSRNNEIYIKKNRLAPEMKIIDQKHVDAIMKNPEMIDRSNVQTNEQNNLNADMLQDEDSHNITVIEDTISQDEAMNEKPGTKQKKVKPQAPQVPQVFYGSLSQKHDDSYYLL